MKLQHTLLATLLAVALAPAIAVASSPNSIAPDIGETSASSMTLVLKCEILAVQPEDGTIRLRELESGTEGTITIADGIQLRARYKKDFGGRRKLAIRDLSAGQNVKVLIDRRTGTITQINVLRTSAT